MLHKLNDGWQFAKGTPENFIPVSIPHDWLIYDPQNLYETSIGWYRRTLPAGISNTDQQVSLHFDGVYMDCTLYVNGIAVGDWKYGYTAFHFNITPFLHQSKENILLLKVRYNAPNARWYTGAGIYRDVFLSIKNTCHFVHDGIYISTFEDASGWHYQVDAEVEAGCHPYTLRHTLVEKDKPIIPWDISTPTLYTLRSELIVDEKVVDSVDTPFGFRSLRFSPDDGFFLNGRHTKLQGVCLHHDLGALGAAVHPDAIARQLALLKAMGVNAIRTAHNPPAKVFMQLADQMGFLIVSEIFDMWHQPKNTFDYARFFDDWHEKDVAAWIRRDRNHPCVIMWSIGNEIPDTHINAQEGGATMSKLIGLVQKHDPRQNAIVTFGSNYMPWPNTQKCADIIKTVGYNYAENLYLSHHLAHPDWLIYGSETSSTTQSRGVYHFPFEQSTLADDDLQCSSLGNSSTSWGAKSIEACIADDNNAPFSLGQFVWAGQDYLGEPTPYHTKNCYFGQLDTAGFPKDSYFIFQAAWTDHTVAPMIHLFPYWDFSPGQPIDVRVCSNAPSVALFLNGDNLGRVALNDSCVANWKIPYQPGCLQAIAYNVEGHPIASCEQRSFTDSATLSVDLKRFGELVYAHISAMDKNGNPVHNANRRVCVNVSGGDLIALDNGDATDYEPYQRSDKRLFNGKLLAIIRTQSADMPTVTATLDESDIPVRQIILSAIGYQITAKIFPSNATFHDFNWRLTNAAGIDSPLGTLKVAPDGLSAEVLPIGDGEVYIRCSPYNGRTHAAFISLLPLQITGTGTPFLNPYSFVSGGLYTASNVPMTNGNERGVATLRDGESHVGFEGLDFGEYGSDEISLWLFPLNKEPFHFDIFQGMPLNNGELLYTAYYDKGSTWNTYIKVTYHLPRRLCGIGTLALRFNQKVHIKGFTFTRYTKAYERLNAAQCDVLYGDSFTIVGDTLENIGNNVTLRYEHMDFGEKGASHVTLCWRSIQPQNTFSLLFENESTSVRAMIEVFACETYQSHSFSLNQVFTGNGCVSVIFLPSTQIDFAWLQFC